MPSPWRMQPENRQKSVHAGILLVGVFFCILAPQASRAQIATDVTLEGRKIFVNAEPPALVKLKDLNNAPKAPKSIYLRGAAASGGGGEIAFMNRVRQDMTVGRDDVEKMVSEAAERHHVDPALVRAVIQTESNWNPAARSRKGALGLMQLIPTTAVRFGVNDAYNPQQNVDAGVHYLRTLLERYNGNLDLALAAYNAGEGAVDRAHGVPAYRETRDYVQKVQNAYYRPGSGRMDSAFVKPRAIHRDVDANGRTIFTNE